MILQSSPRPIANIFPISFGAIANPCMMLQKAAVIAVAFFMSINERAHTGLGVEDF
jgi:hypothetical protein